mmetsp:Transcript_25689/g.65290  ORF Transcript_25689/g.65290 Transcript_25689/m.65290 type:complete len:463 (-) Transcript_25689:129-1517(-)
MFATALLLALHAAAVAAKEVIPLTTANISDAMNNENDMWLLKFYAPWCGHCKRLAPILDEVALEAKGDVHFGKIDCTAEEKLCSSFSVKGFPSIVMVQGESRWVYKGPRKKPDILTLVDRMQRPAITLISSVAELEALHESSAVLFLQGRQPAATGEGTSFEESEEITRRAIASFDAAADKYRHTDIFVATDDPKLLEHAIGELPVAPPPLPFVARLERGETTRFLPTASEEGEEKKLKIGKWIEKQRIPSFSLVDDANFAMLVNSGRPLALLIVDPAALPGQPKALTMQESLSGVGAEMRQLSRDPELREKLVFAMLDGADFGEYLESTFHIPRTSLPRVLVLWKGKRYGMRAFYTSDDGEAASSDSIRHFLERVLAGSVRGEYEGKWGLPARWWRWLTGYVPPLLLLDFLPTFTFAIVFGLLALYGLYLLITSMPSEDYYDRDPAERKAMLAKEASKKDR